MKLNRNSKIVRYFLIIVIPLLFVWLAWSIYRQIKNQPDLPAAWETIKVSFHTTLVWNVIIVFILMIANWSIEALKWKLAVKPVQEVSFGTAIKAVLSGVSFSVSTPNRVGEYLGRVLYMKEGNRLKTISITIVSSISQLIVTLLMGFIGLIILRPAIEANQLISPMWLQVILYGVAIVLSGLLLFYYRLSWLIKWVDRIPGIKRFAYLIEALEEFDSRMLSRLLLLSALRFFVFIVQYYLLFRLFGIDIGWQHILWAVSVSFLVMAIIPSVAILELVQRGKVMTTVMALYTTNDLGVSCTTAGIWVINLIVPAVVGSLLMIKFASHKSRLTRDPDRSKNDNG